MTKPTTTDILLFVELFLWGFTCVALVAALFAHGLEHTDVLVAFWGSFITAQMMNIRRALVRQKGGAR